MLTISLELCRYTAGTHTTRNMRQGQQVINSGLLIMCGVTAETSVNIEFYALCLQTSSITLDPLKHSNLMNYIQYVNIGVCPRKRTCWIVCEMTASVAC